MSWASDAMAADYHGRSDGKFAVTTIYTRDGEIIVSTACVGAMIADFGPDEGHYTLYETKVFGGRTHGKRENFRLDSLFPAADSYRRISESHTAMIVAVVENRVAPGPAQLPA